VEADNLIEERLGNCGGRVGVAEVDKMCILGEVIHHGEDDRLAIDTGESFDEVHRDIHPNQGGNRQWLKEARGEQLFTFVALAHRTSLLLRCRVYLMPSWSVPCALARTTGSRGEVARM
jgi:hypothetical protein